MRTGDSNRTRADVRQRNGPALTKRGGSESVLGEAIQNSNWVMVVDQVPNLHPQTVTLKVDAFHSLVAKED